MSLLVLPLALVAAEPVAEPPVENEIEVIGTKLRNWSGRWNLRKGAVRCKTTRSTGDKEIDAIGCDAMVQCIAPFVPQLDALEAAKLSKDEMRVRVGSLLEQAGVTKCLTRTRNDGIAALVAARRSKRS